MDHNPEGVSAVRQVMEETIRFLARLSPEKREEVLDMYRTEEGSPVLNDHGGQ